MTIPIRLTPSENPFDAIALDLKHEEEPNPFDSIGKPTPAPADALGSVRSRQPSTAHNDRLELASRTFGTSSEETVGPFADENARAFVQQPTPGTNKLTRATAVRDASVTPATAPTPYVHHRDETLGTITQLAAAPFENPIAGILAPVMAAKDAVGTLAAGAAGDIFPGETEENAPVSTNQKLLANAQVLSSIAAPEISQGVQRVATPFIGRGAAALAGGAAAGAAPGAAFTPDHPVIGGALGGLAGMLHAVAGFEPPPESANLADHPDRLLAGPDGRRPGVPLGTRVKVTMDGAPVDAPLEEPYSVKQNTTKQAVKDVAGADDVERQSIIATLKKAIGEKPPESHLDASVQQERTPSPQNDVGGFTTAKGSTYVVEPDGRTTRDKAARPEHPNDAGPQPTSQRTYYVDRAGLDALGEFQSEGAGKRVIADVGDGRIGVRYEEGKDAGKFEGRTVVTPQRAPGVGLYPVEVWKDGTSVHFGNKITGVSSRAPSNPFDTIEEPSHPERSVARVESESEDLPEFHTAPNETAEARAERFAKHPLAPRNLIGKSHTELRELADKETHSEKNAELEVFGEEGAKRYKAAQRTVNSDMGHLNPDRYANAIATIHEMESDLTRAQADRLFGTADGGLNAQELGDAARWANDYAPHNTYDMPEADLYSTIGRELTTGSPEKDLGSALRLKGAAEEIMRRSRQSMGDVLKRAVLERINRGYARPEQATELLEAKLQVMKKAGINLAGEPKQYDYSSTQINMPQDLREAMIRHGASRIPDEELAADGREYTPHITVKYGLHGNSIDTVRELLANEPPIRATFGKSSLFSNDDADVVKLDVDSPDLRRLNKKISDAVPHSDTHPSYVPHATVAYVKPGMGKKYAGDATFEGHTVEIDHVTFSDRDGNKVDIPLRGQRTAGALGSGEPDVVSDNPFDEIDRANETHAMVDDEGASSTTERRTKGIPAGTPVIASKVYDKAVHKGHADYTAAKSGDVDAATRFVEDQVDPKTVDRARDAFGSDAIYVAPVAQERAGLNAIPQMLAEYYAESTGARTDQHIVQANRAFHTGADPMERLVSPVSFAGDVEHGGKYVLVDDVVTSGGTLASLAHYIQARGGEVAGVVTLANASRSGQLDAPAQRLTTLDRRLGHVIREELGVEPSALTNEESGYLIGFRSPDELRGRAAAARETRAKRAREKGVQSPPPNANEVTPDASQVAESPDRSAESGDRVSGPRSPEFKQWFGDSAVVDSDGQPLVVYHGTQGEFDALQPSKSGQFGPAIYLTADLPEAEKYSRATSQVGTTPNVKRVYVRMEKPLMLRATNLESPPREWFPEYGAQTQATVDRWKALGYDGVIADQPRVLGGDHNNKAVLGPWTRHYVPFDAEQVRVASGPDRVSSDDVHEFAAPSRGRDTSAELRTAFADWSANRAYFKNGNYYLKGSHLDADGFVLPTEERTRARIAPWSKAVKAAYPDNMEFARAARNDVHAFAEDTAPTQAPRREPKANEAVGSAADIDNLPDAAGLEHERPSIRVRELLPALRALFNVEGLSEGARDTAGTIRHQGAVGFHELAVARERLREFGRRFGQLKKADAVKYWDAAERGAQTGDAVFDQGATALHNVTRKFTEQMIALDRLKAEAAIENWIGRYWDTSGADPRKSLDVIRRAVGKRPLEGPKSFLKQRSWEYFTDGLKAIADAKERIKSGSPMEGDERLSRMRPATYNYVDSALAKLAEIQRVLSAERMLRAELSSARAKRVMIGGDVPVDENGASWVRIGDGTDPAFIVYGPPVHTVHEAYDAGIRKGLEDALERLRVKHTRAASIGGKGLPKRALGYAKGGGEIASKFGSHDGVIMHELGHILDARYGIRAKLAATPATNAELRRLAELRHEFNPAATDKYKEYVQTDEEKMANALHALIHAPERMQEVAPQTKRILTAFLKSKPELAPILDIKPSLSIESGKAEARLPGPTLAGYWYAPKASSAVWGNYLSRGWRGNALYDAFMAPAQASTQILLGLSGFHATTIATEGMFSDLALAIDHLANGGSMKEAVKAVLRAPAAPFRMTVKGRKIMQEYRAPGTHPELAKVLDAMIAGGYRGTAQLEYINGDRLKKLKRAFTDAVESESAGRRLWGASRIPLDALWAGIEIPTQFLMGRYVPWMKTAATYEMTARELAKLPQNATDDAIHRVMGDVVKEMDLRFGQVTYENWFVHNAVKHLAQMVFLAPGWTFGTATLTARGAKQAAAIPFRAGAKGVRAARKFAGQDVPDDAPEPLVGKSAAYWIAAVLGTALINAWLTKTHTGENPHGKDFFAYRDGTKDADGNPNRHRIPGYLMHDVYGYFTHPVDLFRNKMAPTLAFMARAAANKDYFGDMLYDPQAPIAEKAKQIGTAAAKNLGTPLSVQNFLEDTKRGEHTAGDMARNAFGVTPAKREFVRTDAQNLMAEFLERRGHDSRTPAQVDSAKTRADVFREFREGERSRGDIIQLERAGELTRSQGQSMIRRARQSGLVGKFESLSLDEAEQVFEKANDEERQLWWQPLLHKRGSARRARARSKGER